MNYEEMSDFEINKRVAIALRPFLFNYKCTEGTDGEVRFTGDDDNRTFNYLKWVNYAWPIIVESGISIDYWGEVWAADIQYRDRRGEIEFEHEDKNPLRAAMICFLKMKDAESNAN